VSAGPLDAFSDLSTALVADACLRRGLPLRAAPRCSRPHGRSGWPSASRHGVYAAARRFACSSPSTSTWLGENATTPSACAHLRRVGGAIEE